MVAILSLPQGVNWHQAITWTNIEPVDLKPHWQPNTLQGHFPEVDLPNCNVDWSYVYEVCILPASIDGYQPGCDQVQQTELDMGLMDVLCQADNYTA